MRDIEFRAKETKTGAWVYGYYEDYMRCFNEGREMGTIHQESDWGLNISFKVYSDTVGQYSGISDRNKQRIYEGDILRMYSGSICVVEWFDGRGSICHYVGLHAREFYHSDGEYIDTADMKDIHREWGRSEKIGNIHDNPELIVS